MDFTMVVRTDHEYVNRMKIKDTWYHRDETERNLWREAMRKAMRYMAHIKLWCKDKISTVPKEGKIIGNKCIFKCKGNGIYCACLVTLRYS